METMLPDYKKIAAGVEKRKVFVEEREIEEVLKWLRHSRAKFTLKNRPAQKGDFLEIEYRLPRTGLDPQKDAFILGQGHFLQGFEENLIGMNVGEKKNIVIKKDGKDVEVEVEIKSIQNIELPEVGDEFAKSLPRTILKNNEPKKEDAQKTAYNLRGFESLTDLKKDIRERLNSEKKQAEIFRQRNKILEKINQRTECEIPDGLVMEEQKQMLENFQNWVKENLKISFEQYLSKVKKTEKEMSDIFLTQSKQKVKSLIILEEIGKREGVDLDDLKKYNTEEARIEKIFQILEGFGRKS